MQEEIKKYVEAYFLGVPVAVVNGGDEIVVVLVVLVVVVVVVVVDCN